MERRSSPGKHVALGAFVALMGIVATLSVSGRYVYLMKGSNWVPVWLVVAILALAVSLRRGVGVRWIWHDWPLWLFAASMTAGLVHPTDRALALRFTVCSVFLLVSLYTVGRTLLRQPDLWRGTCSIIATISAGVALFGVVEVALGFNPLYEGLLKNPYYDIYVVQRRPLATQFNPAPLGTFLLLSWPFAAYLTELESRASRWLGYVSLGLGTICLFLTFSRGALLGLIVVVGITLLRRKGTKGVVALGVLTVLVITIATFLPYPISKFGVHGFFGAGGMSSEGKIWAVRFAAQDFRTHPVFGVGHGQIRHEWLEARSAGLQTSHPGTLDNAYIHLFAETGAVGSLGFLVFVAFLCRRVLRAYRDSSPATRSLATAVGLALLGLSLNAPGYSMFWWTTPWMYACLLFGFAAGLKGDRHVSRTTPGDRRVITPTV